MSEPEMPIGTMDENGNVDGKPLADWFGEAMDQVEGSSSYRWDRDRPYNGQPHTDHGERGKTLVVGLTMRDVADCFAQALLDCCGVDQPELYVRADRALHRDMYDVDLTHIDPGAWQQNLTCRIEKMMGIFPNAPPLTWEEAEGE